MKQLLLVLVSLFFFNFSYASLPIAKTVAISSGENKAQDQQVQIEAIQNLSVKDYEKITGKKLSFVNRILFKIKKKALISQLTKEPNPYTFNWGGFVLGLLYGPIGLLAAYIFSKSNNFRKSTFFGFKIWVVVLLVFSFVILSLAGGKFK